MKKFFAAIAVVSAMAALPAQAQSNNLFEQNGAFFGRVNVIPGSHFEINNNSTVIKTFRGAGSPVSNGTPGVLLTFGQWNSSGQHIASGQGQFFQNGVVMLRWTNESTAGVWRNIDSGWRTYIPR